MFFKKNYLHPQANDLSAACVVFLQISDSQYSSFIAEKADFCRKN
jgi:hypothetical protein